MRDEPTVGPFRHDDSLRRGLRGLVVGIALFAVLGTVTAVWANPLFVRMTPVGPWEFGATVLTALLAGVTATFWVPECRLRGSGTGGPVLWRPLTAAHGPPAAARLALAVPRCYKGDTNP